MTRTDIDLDDELVTEAMRRFGLATKREAVDLALRRLLGPVVTSEEMLAMEGTGWDGDLEAMRADPVEHW
jgi:Arc/MetJ family transcription regulator